MNKVFNDQQIPKALEDILKNESDQYEEFLLNHANVNEWIKTLESLLGTKIPPIAEEEIKKRLELEFNAGETFGRIETIISILNGSPEDLQSKR